LNSRQIRSSWTDQLNPLNQLNPAQLPANPKEANRFDYPPPSQQQQQQQASTRKLNQGNCVKYKVRLGLLRLG
jgi:hypothetical protein